MSKDNGEFPEKSKNNVTRVSISLTEQEHAQLDRLLKMGYKGCNKPTTVVHKIVSDFLFGEGIEKAFDTYLKQRQFDKEIAEG